MQTIETALTAVGLTTPTRRFIAFGLGVGAIIYLSKPGFAFDGDGNSRPWTCFTLGSSDDPDAIPSTSIPWWLLAAIVGLLAAMLL